MKTTIKSRNAYIDQKLPETCVMTKGVKPGQLWLFDQEEWRRFQNWLEKNLSHSNRDHRVILRHFFVEASGIEIERVRDVQGTYHCKVPIPPALWSWLGGKSGNNFTWEYIERRTDTWAARWEITNQDTEGAGKK